MGMYFMLLLVRIHNLAELSIVEQIRMFFAKEGAVIDWSLDKFFLKQIFFTNFIQITSTLKYCWFQCVKANYHLMKKNNIK